MTNTETKARALSEAQNQLFVEQRIKLKQFLMECVLSTVGSAGLDKRDVETETFLIAYISSLHERAGFVENAKQRALAALHGDLVETLIARNVDLTAIIMENDNDRQQKLNSRMAGDSQSGQGNGS